jgi:4-hydroxy-tetrahydrodipicolinate reductase
MTAHPEYNVEIKEVHHIHKLDAPSGTGISIAEDIIRIMPDKSAWVNDKEPASNEINIKSERRGEVSGIHTVKYDSDIDCIEITHSAKTRKGLALGAVLAAEYCINNSGILTMNELLNI